MPFTLDRSKDITPQLIKQAEQSAATFTALFRKRMQRVSPQIMRDLRIKPAKRPDLPFVWSTNPVKNARARRWYFANKVRRGSPGGRYVRTGGLSDSWQVATNVFNESGSVEAFNDVPGAEFVIGDHIVPSHVDTGWGRVTGGVVQEYQVLLEDGVTEDYYAAVGGI